MSGDVQPRKRNKDKKRRREDSDVGRASFEYRKLSMKDDDETRPTGVHATKMGPDDIQLHVHSDHGTGGHWCAKIFFFSLLAILLGLIGLILLENRGLSDLDTPLSESRFADMLEGWVDEERELHDEHDSHATSGLHEHDDDHEEDHDQDDHEEDHDQDDHEEDHDDNDEANELDKEDPNDSDGENDEGFDESGGTENVSNDGDDDDDENDDNDDEDENDSDDKSQENDSNDEVEQKLESEDDNDEDDNDDISNNHIDDNDEGIVTGDSQDENNNQDDDESDDDGDDDDDDDDISDVVEPKTTDDDGNDQSENQPDNDAEEESSSLAVRIIVGLALVLVAHHVLIKRPQINTDDIPKSTSDSETMPEEIAELFEMKRRFTLVTAEEPIPSSDEETKVQASLPVDESIETIETPSTEEKPSVNSLDCNEDEIFSDQLIPTDDIEQKEFDINEELLSDEEELLSSEGHDYDSESSEVDDTDLLKRLDEKYGKLPTPSDDYDPDDCVEDEDIDPTWTKIDRSGPASFPSDDHEHDDKIRQANEQLAEEFEF